ncbi:hypothetical protein K3495_g11629 [Podosphaera aphanis]|nr:hypothetical protein K3495_g11629 [Podosphaera aphanis]
MPIGSTPQLSKNLSWINTKYQVTTVMDSHCVKLNTPSGIWPKFHVDLIKRAAKNPLPSQIVDDLQPDPIKQHNPGIENDNFSVPKMNMLSKELHVQKLEK